MKLSFDYLQNLILEEITKEVFSVSRKDIIDLLNRRFIPREEEMRLEVLYDYYDNDPEEVEKLLSWVSEIGRDIIKKLPEVPYINIKDIKERLLTTSNLYEYYGDNNKSGFYPFPIYISASPEDKNTIGLSLFFDGKLKMFEGNDEASPETIDLVNELLGAPGEKIKIYGNHASEVVEKIRELGVLPKNLYVSPSREHSAGYWGENRVLFSGIISKGDISQESEFDWKTIRDAKIEKFKYI